MKRIGDIVFVLPNSVPSLDDGDEQCHLHLQLLVVYSSLLREVCIHVSKGVLKHRNQELIQLIV